MIMTKDHAIAVQVVEPLLVSAEAPVIKGIWDI